MGHSALSSQSCRGIVFVFAFHFAIIIDPISFVQKLGRRCSFFQAAECLKFSEFPNDFGERPQRRFFMGSSIFSLIDHFCT